MEYFRLNTQFDDYASLMATKKLYEEASNSILVKADTKLLKGDSDLARSAIYERIIFKCKAGPERPTQSNGFRNSSTIKKGCSVMVRLILKDGKLTVKESQLKHENHATDKATFDHYAENLRIPEDKLKDVEKMISLGVNKQKLKASLMEDGKTIVPLRVLHNIQIKQRQKSQSNYSGDDDLAKVLSKLQQIPNARVRVVTSDENELIGIYFQDDRMAQLYDRYPEVMLFDTTYKMNNQNLPLVLQLCVDGNGETEICNMFIAQSESRLCVGAMVEIFQELNPAWTKTRVIIGDKDFADRAIYSEMFPNAVLQICLYHVLVTFGREITTAKRNITKEEREAALDILQRLVYSISEELYDSIYAELVALDLEDVMKYYDENWHEIRNEWTLYGRNKFSNYLNSTNNRTESINQKFKMLGNRYSNLLTFFENIFTTVSILSSERNIRAVTSTMRVPRRRFDNEFIARYYQLVTPFIFRKIEEQYELSEKIEFSVMLEETGITKKRYQQGHAVTEQHCSCMFFSAMDIPCRHIFQFLTIKGLDLFVPNLVAQRWTKAYYYKSHPAISNYEQLPAPQPISFSSIRVPEEIEKFKKVANMTKDINNFAASMSNSEFQFYYDKIKDFRNEVVSSRIPNRQNALPESTNQRISDESTSVPGIMQSILPRRANVLQSTNEIISEPQSDVPPKSSNTIAQSSLQLQEVLSTPPVIITTSDETSVATISKVTNEIISEISQHQYDVPQTASCAISKTTLQQQELLSKLAEFFATSNESLLATTSNVVNEIILQSQSDVAQTASRSISQASLQQPDSVSKSAAMITTSMPVYSSTNNMQHIKLPPKIVPVGRPKGTGKTVIGTKRKNPVKALPIQSTVPQPPKKKVKFSDRNADEQGRIIVQWLTNWPMDRIKKKRVTNGDIIQDPIIFNRLKNEMLDINGIKKYLYKKTFQYIENEVDRVNPTQHYCAKCRKLLNGLQVMCHGCLDWYHVSK